MTALSGLNAAFVMSSKLEMATCWYLQTATGRASAAWPRHKETDLVILRATVTFIWERARQSFLAGAPHSSSAVANAKARDLGWNCLMCCIAP
jgi:hypothetical protein